MALEPDVFDFEEWITFNGLNQIKELLIKHDLKSTNNLSTQSAQFAKFISDPVLLQTKPDLITTVVHAIQKLSNFIVISEKEENVLKLLKSHLKELKSSQLLVDQLADKYGKSMQDYNERKKIKIGKIEREIVSFTTELMNAITTKEQTLLSELSSFCDRNNMRNIDEQKEIQILSESNILIARQRKKLTSALQNIDNMIHKSVDLSHNDRKEQVLNIGASINSEFNETTATLNANIHSIQKVIYQNKTTEFDINFKASKNVQSMAENEEYEEEGFITKQENETSSVNYEEQNSLIRELKASNDELKKEIENYRYSNYDLKKKVQNFKVSNYDLIKEIEDKNRNIRELKRNRRTSNATRTEKAHIVPLITRKWKQSNRAEPKYEIIHKSDNVWNVTMHYKGKTMVRRGNSKANAINNCIDAFKHRYGGFVPIQKTRQIIQIDEDYIK